MLRFVSALHVSTEDCEQIAQDKDILLRRIVFKRLVFRPSGICYRRRDGRSPSAICP